jgi:hypothetical protein
MVRPGARPAQRFTQRAASNVQHHRWDGPIQKQTSVRHPSCDGSIGGTGFGVAVLGFSLAWLSLVLEQWSRGSVE